jgi:putative SOS response-associated peptidase YedK
MVNRYSITASANTMAARFKVEVPEYYKPRYNAAPTQLLPVILSSGPKGISWFYWGRPETFAHNKPLGEKIINLHAETLMERPVLKRTVLRNRCIIPADGWYAWKKVGKKIFVPHRFTLANNLLFSFAGLWEEFEDEHDEKLHTFTILTTMPGESTITDRVPVILNEERESIWLSANATEHELFSLLKPHTGESLSVYPVSHRINDMNVDHASLILPAPATDQHGNLTLFD